MTRSLPSLVFVSLISISAALTTRFDRHVVHERRNETTTWNKHDVVDKSMILPMRIGLTQRNLDKGHDLLMGLSHPESSKYGQWYSAEEVQDLFAPSQQSVETVRNWLESSGIAPHRISQSANKQWIQFDAEAKEVEDLLNTKYHVYKHASSDRHSIGCDEYHVPENIQRHIDYITPGVKAVNVKVSKSAKRSSVKREDTSSLSSRTIPSYGLPSNVPDYGSNWFSLNNCARQITPSCIRALYNFTQINSNPFSGNGLGIFESGDFYDQPDLDLFFKHWQPRIPKGTHPILHSIDGGKAPAPQAEGGGESLLDFQLAFPLVWPINITLYQTDDDYYSEGEGFQKYDGFFNTFLDGIDGSYCTYSAYEETGNSKIDPSYPDKTKGGYKGQLQCGVWKPTNVISLSYAVVETGGGLPRNYEQRQCSEYMKLSMQGITFIFSSGDGGVGHIGSAQDCADVTSQAFGPMFPASCPYVTSVGSTVLVNASSSGGSRKGVKEVATQSFGSGGGFSNVFPRPDYQNKAVEGYFASPGPPTYPYYTGSKYGKGYYNRTGRGIPDVSALGDNILVYAQGNVSLSGGTSASAPIFASLITNINELRLKAGKTAVGFINPVLYANPRMFHDVTEGDNPGCFTKGFNATVGWDPVTGLGTPNWEAMVGVFMGLP